MSGFDPGPEPSHGVPDVPHGHIITPDHPAWHRRHDPEVWGELAEPGTHNPMHDRGMVDTGPYWGNGETHRYWSHLAEHDPAKHATATAAMHHVLPGLHPTISLSTHALHRVLDDREVRPAFVTGTSGGTFDHDISRYLEERRMGEYAHFRYPMKDHPDYARPVYGSLTDDPEADRSTSGYGEHTLVLSRPALAHRTTWASTDTLNDLDRVRATPLTEPHLRSVMPSMVNWRGIKDKPDHGVADVLGHHSSRSSYLEAQFHGGVGLHHVHYAILREPLRRDPAALHSLTKRLSEAGIPWVRSREDPSDILGRHRLFEHDNTHRREALLAAHESIATGAFAASHHPAVRWHQGDDRFLVELAAPGPRGLPMAQIADLEWGALYPPQPIDSILARGYWERLPHPVEAVDILAKVRPVT